MLEGPFSLAIVGGALYVSESKPGRISRVDPATGRKEIFVAGVVGKAALADDGEGSLLALSGTSGKLYRIDPRNAALSIVAEGLPVGYLPIGSDPPGVELAPPISVAAGGDVYLATAGRGVIALRRSARTSAGK